MSVAGLFDPQQLIHPPPVWLDLTQLPTKQVRVGMVQPGFPSNDFN